MPGRHHIETPPGDPSPKPVGTLVVVGIAVLVIIAGVATIAAWVAPSADAKRDLSTIVVQPSASLPVPSEAPDVPSPDEPPSGIPTPPSAPPIASVSPSDAGDPAASAALLVDSAPLPPPSTVAQSPVAPISSAPPMATPPTPTTAPSPPRDLTATYTVTSTSTDGFVAAVAVDNPTVRAQAWTVVLTYSSGMKMTVTGYWNATPIPNGRRLSFEGGPLPAGASYSFGFQVATDKTGDITLTACTINGLACAGS